jgi:transposase
MGAGRSAHSARQAWRRQATVVMRNVVDGVMYILSTGCQWRAIPKDLPPRSTLFDYLDLWSWDGTLERIHHELYVKCREREEREASPYCVAYALQTRNDQLICP